MKKFITVALIIGLVTLLANAKEKSIQPVKTNKKIVCFPIDSLLDDLKNKYGEEPMVMGITENMDDVGMSLFINRDTGSYTVIEFDKEAGCIVSVGNNVRYRFPKTSSML